MTLRTTVLGRTAIAAVTPLLALAALVVPATPAQAAAERLGGVMWSENKGNAESLLTIYSEGPCPAAAEYVRATLYGPGMPKDGKNIVTPTSLLLSKTEPMGLSVSNAFVIYAEEERVALDGEYTVAIECTDEFGVPSLGRFTTTMTWDTPGGRFADIDRATYSARDSAEVERSAVFVPENDVMNQIVPEDVPADPQASGPAGADEKKQPDAPATAPAAPQPDAGASAATPAPSDAPAAASAPAADDGIPAWAWLAVAAVLAVAAGALWFRTSRRPAP